MNLIINARDAMPDGGLITASGENKQVDGDNALGLPAGDYVVLAVADSGSGIPAEIIEQVTEPFFTTKDFGKGTGLGLSMVYGFARQSGGALEIVSKEGEGTRVEIWLPRAAAPPEEAATAQANAKAPPVRPLRVLLVDDHDVVRETTAALLADMGHTVTPVGDGQSMLDLLAQSPDIFDVVVTDYAMPLMSGSEMLVKARQIRHALPGVIITGYADSQSIAEKPSEVVVVSKPFTFADMQAALAKVVCD